MRPETTGFLDALKEKFSGFGGGLSGIGTALGVGLVGAAGAALLAVGEMFEKSRFQIERETGLTGKAAAHMFDSAKAVFGTVPDSLGKVTSAIDFLYQRTQLTGKPLEALTTQFLNLGRVTGIDVKGDMETLLPLFTKFGITAQQIAPHLDAMYVASQKTGVSVTTISGLMEKGGAALQQYGLNFDQSTAFVSKLSEVAGGKARVALQSLQTGFAKLTKEGHDPHAVFLQMISDMTHTGTQAEGTKKIIDTFGARGGLELANALKRGAGGFAALTQEMEKGRGTINKTAFDTLSLSDKFTILYHKGLNAIEPLASKFLDFVNKALDKISDWVSAHGDQIQSVFAAIGAVFEDKIAPAARAVWSALQPVFDAIGHFVASNVRPILAGIAGAFAAIAAPAIVAGVSALVGSLIALASAIIGPELGIALLAAGLVYAYQHFSGFRAVVQDVADFLVNTAWPAIQEFAKYIVKEFGDLATFVRVRWKDIQAAVHNVITAIKIEIFLFIGPILIAWKLFHSQILDVARAVWTYLRSIVQNGLEIIRGIIDVVLGILSGHWSRAWDGVKEIFGGVWKDIISLMQLFGKLLLEGLDIVWHGVLDAIGAFVPKVIGFFLKLPGMIVGAVVGLDVMLVKWMASAFVSLISSLPGAAARLAQWFIALPSNIIAWIGDIASQFIKIGEDIINGIIKGIGNLAGSLGSSLIGAIGKAGGGLLHHLGIGSPSKWYADNVGTPIVQGIAQGIINNQHLVGNALTGATGAGVVPKSFGSGVASAVAGIPSAGSARARSAHVTIQQLTLAPVFPPGMNPEETLAHMKDFTLTTMAETLENIAGGNAVGAGARR